MKRLHLIIFGNVQGVSFRYYALKEANKLRLTGYVKNLPDENVEIIAEGPEKELKQMIEWARHGPSGAYVSDIKAYLTESSDEFESFQIRY